MHKYIILSLAFLNTLNIFLNTTFAQSNDKKISGTVLDGQTFHPLPFANISFYNSNIGTTSDLKGNFTITNSINAEQMVISYIGYKSLIINLSNLNYFDSITYYLIPINILLQEVTVYSHSTKNLNLSETNNLSMQSERIREISPTMPDILRSIQAFPGIAVNNEFKADFNVRGGNQHENLVLVNNAQVYEPFHIKEIANASVGIFNVDLVNRVDLVTGGFSAKYGDKMSSVLNILYREGNKEKFSGAASLSLAYLDGYVEGPLTDDISFIIGLRKSYLEYLISMIDYEDISSMKPSFYDAQGVLAFNLSPSNKILLEFIHSGDTFTYLPFKEKFPSPFISSFNGEDARFTRSNSEKEDYNASYFTNLFDLQSINILSNKLLFKGEISYYQENNDEYRLSIQDNNQDIKTLQSNLDYFEKINTTRLTFDTLIIKTLEFKTDLDYQLSPLYEINFGLSYKSITYNQIIDDIYTIIRKENFNNPDVTNTDTIITKGELAEDNPIDTKSYKYHAYLENILQATDDLIINIGGRIDYFDLNKELSFSPRLNAGFRIDKNTTLRAAWGYYYQSPIYQQLLYSTASDTNTKSQKAIHYILGIDHFIDLSNNMDDYIQLKAEIYFKDYKSLISSKRGVFERLIYSRRNDAIGTAKGLDLLAKLSYSRFYFWFAYSLLFAVEDNLTDNIGSYPRYTDQRHSISFVSNINAGDGWNFSLKAFYGSGFPYTPRTAVFTNGSWEWQFEKIHSAYLPAYKRVDIRVSKDFDFYNSTLNVFIDVSNVFNFKNIQDYEYKTPGFSKPTPEEVHLWPILPSLGIRYSF